MKWFVVLEFGTSTKTNYPLYQLMKVGKSTSTEQTTDLYRVDQEVTKRLRREEQKGLSRLTTGAKIENHIFQFTKRCAIIIIVNYKEVKTNITSYLGCIEIYTCEHYYILTYLYPKNNLSSHSLLLRFSLVHGNDMRRYRVD